MSRLTKIYEIHNNKPISYKADVSGYPDMMGYEYEQAEMDIVNKLGQLEDIEEELGIDLITLFKALKNGIYKKGRNNLKGLILYSKMPMFSFYHKTIDAELIEDYGKTWALSRKELENETSI